jgi:hypothetical protein
MNANFGYFAWKCLLLLAEVWSSFAKFVTMIMKEFLT